MILLLLPALGMRQTFKSVLKKNSTFHTKMGTIKDTYSKDLTEAEEVKKRWQEYTELYLKDHNAPDNHKGVITHVETNISE